jgi:hypothetical protein
MQEEVLMAGDYVSLMVLIGMIGAVGGIIARDRAIGGMIVSGDKSVHDDLGRKLDIMHERINKTRDEFVRKDDLDAHVTRMERMMEHMYEEMKGTNQRIDNFMSNMVRERSGQRA